MIIGIDEVGRGAWAGDMLFCAVALGEPITGLADSKVISKKKREELTEIIKQNASFIGYGWVSASEIDDLGLTKASQLACERAIEKAPKDAKIFIDGKVNFLSNNPQTECIVDGDATVPEISAASILAKVTRDKYMAEQAEKYPNYSFEKNVGYGTKAHMDSIKKYGLTPIHRWSYKPIKEFTDTYEA